MLKEAKQPNHVLGKKMNCPNFNQCPICYGCRSYTTTFVECEKCIANKKRDVCNTELHKSDLIEKLIRKDEIKFDKAKFISSINNKEVK